MLVVEFEMSDILDWESYSCFCDRYV